MLLNRLKSLALILCTALSLWTAPALAAGTLPIAMAQQVDINGRPLANCQVNFYVAGTVASPQNSFADFGLTQTNPQTLVCDQNGRVPMFWLADGLVHVRMIDPSGVPLIDTTMQVLGPSSGGGGGGGTVDPTAIIATGDVKVKYGTGPLSGFVRANALTIGNAGSGATERANADVQSLYVYLYGADPNLVVVGGRSGNALNDFNAGKQLTMPDFRSRALAGLGDMGNADNTLFSGVSFTSGNSTTLGSLLGAARRTLAASQIPTITSSNPAVIHLTSTVGFWTGGSLVQFDGVACCVVQNPGFSQVATDIPIGVAAVTSTNTGGAAFDSVSTYGLVTIYLKL